MSRDLEQRLIADDAVARHVAGLRLALAPGRDGRENAQESLVGGTRLEPLPGIDRVELVEIGILQRRDLPPAPRTPPGAPEIALQLLVHLAKMGHIGQGVVELALVERAAAPIGEAHRFVELGVGEAANQRFVGSGIAEAAHHRGDLGVEQGLGMTPP